MRIEPNAARTDEFRANHLPWLVVRHFLSADLIEELCSAIVTATSRGAVAFTDLFDILEAGGGSCLGSWAIRPRPVSLPLAGFLQRVVSEIAWQADGMPVFYEPDAPPAEAAAMKALEAALLLSHSDFGTLDSAQRHLQDVPPGLKQIASAMAALRDDVEETTPIDGLAPVIEKLVEGFETPLRALVVKHLGDLAADADRWSLADALYEAADVHLAGKFIPDWQHPVQAFRAMVAQSRAAAAWNLRGAASATESLSRSAQGDLASNPVFQINSAPDLLTSLLRGQEGIRFPDDNRVRLLVAPQLLDSRSLGSALEASQDGKNSDFVRRFWSVLRRQIALGSTVYVNSTKAYYGRALISEAQRDRRAPEVFFSMGVRLLVESGNAGATGQAQWSGALARSEITEALVAETIQRTMRAPGVIRERRLVVIELFKQWTIALPPEGAAIASQMLAFLTATARCSAWTPPSDRNLLGASLDALQEIAKARPELRSVAASGVAAATTRALSVQNIDAMTTAIETTLAYLDAFEQADLRDVVKATLSVLAGLSSGRGPWVLLRPAIELLSSEPVRTLCAEVPDLGKQVHAALLRAGLENESEYTNLLYLLKDADPADLASEIDAQRLQSAIASIRTHAAEINSSASTSNIMALLIAPALATRDGVREALDALLAILRSASEGRPTISFAYAYDPIMYLTDFRHRLVTGLRLTEPEVDRMVEPLLEELTKVWRRAPQNPLMFAGFSIPEPSKPNSTLVHNWTFASIGFARSFGQADMMAAAMNDASNHALLIDAMAVGRAVRVTAGDPEHFDLEAIKAERRDAFYAALGRRLVLLSQEPPEHVAAVIGVFLEQCFRLGPKGIDGAVFTAAFQRRVRIVPSNASASYRRRVDNDPELRLSLTPMLEALKPVEQDPVA
jgi:hypothetical protein